MCSTTGLNICAIIARIKKYKSVIKKKKKELNEIALLAKTNLDSTKASISRSLTVSYIGCDYFLFIDVLWKYDGMKETGNFTGELKLLTYL